MTDSTPLTHADLDWNRLWQNARDRRGWSSKGARDWDKKSASFAERNSDSPFAALLLNNLALTPEMTVLDMGCGPGTLALPLAKRCRRVAAVDFSEGMLNILRERCQQEGISNIDPINCAWEDDWQEKGVPVCDLAIAARSMNVADLQAAIEKLAAHAERTVCIVDRISPTPFDPELFAAVGREFESGPDYIYTLNMLYTMGIHPNVQVMALERELVFGTLEQALQSYSWMIKEITPAEEERLRGYLAERATRREDGSLVILREPPPRWALIWWQQ